MVNVRKACRKRDRTGAYLAVIIEPEWRLPFWRPPMILSVNAAKLNQRSEVDFKVRCYAAALIVQAVSW